MTRAAPSRLTLGVLAIAMVVILVLSPVIGSIASVVASLLVLLITPAAFRGDWRQAVFSQPAILVLLVCFVVLAAVFAITADEVRDVAYAANFIGLPLAMVLYLVLRRVPFIWLGEALLWLCLAGSIAAALIAAYDVVVMHEARAHGFAGGPNLLPRVAITLGFVAFAGLFVVKGTRQFLFYLGPIAATIATFYSASRGAALAIPVLTLLAMLMLVLDRTTRRHAWIMLALAALGIVAAMFVLSNSSLMVRFAGTLDMLVELLTTGRSRDQAATERLAVLETAWPAFLASPLVGWGWGNMREAISTVAPPLAPWLGDNVFYHADAANFAVAGGIAGLLAWLGMLAAPLAGTITGPRDSANALRLYVALALTLSFAIYGVSDFTLGYDLPTTLYAFVVAIIFGAFGGRRSQLPLEAAAVKAAA